MLSVYALSLSDELVCSSSPPSGSPCILIYKETYPPCPPRFAPTNPCSPLHQNNFSLPDVRFTHLDPSPHDLQPQVYLLILWLMHHLGVVIGQMCGVHDVRGSPCGWHQCPKIKAIVHPSAAVARLQFFVNSVCAFEVASATSGTFNRPGGSPASGSTDVLFSLCDMALFDQEC